MSIDTVYRKRLIGYGEDGGHPVQSPGFGGIPEPENMKNRSGRDYGSYQGMHRRLPGFLFDSPDVEDGFFKSLDYEKPKAGDYYRSIRIFRVSRYRLGDGVLGRAFPRMGVIEILYELYGNDFLEVLQHEKEHIYHPEMDELQIRHRVRESLPFRPRFH